MCDIFSLILDLSECASSNALFVSTVTVASHFKPIPYVNPWLFNSTKKSPYGQICINSTKTAPSKWESALTNCQSIHSFSVCRWTYCIFIGIECISLISRCCINVYHAFALWIYGNCGNINDSVRIHISSHLELVDYCALLVGFARVKPTSLFTHFNSAVYQNKHRVRLTRFTYIPNCSIA